jgi:hypothetical protein
MSSRHHRKRVFFILIALVLAIGGATIIIPRVLRSDFRKSLAKQLNVDAEFLHLNIPPAPNRLPGAAFVMRGPLLPLVPSLARDQLNEGSIFEMEWRELARDEAQSQITAGPWRGLFSAETDDVFRIRLHDCRILEAAPERIRKQLLESEEVRRQSNAGYKALVIVRSYEGRMELKVERGSKSSAELWARKVKFAQEVDGLSLDGKLKVASADDEKLVLSWTAPVVFAYEAAEARLFADHLGVKPDKVELTPLRASKATSPAEPAQSPTTPAANSLDSKKND